MAKSDPFSQLRRWLSKGKVGNLHLELNGSGSMGSFD